MSADERASLLLVEDNAGDARLFMEALKELKATHELAVVRDGVEALDYLFQRGKFAGVRRPDLVLLDLNLPRKDGREVLSQVKADGDLRRIPVIVLTTSRSDEDAFKAYDLHANCFVTKPVDMLEFLDVVKAIDLFWLKIARLPPR